MTISPIQASQMLEGINRSENTAVSGALPFEDVLGKAIQAVEEADASVKADMVDLALGNTDSLHNIVIDAAKADLAVYTLVSVRNKALEAYNEIMRITL